MQKNKNNYLLPILFASIMLSPNFKIISALPVFRFEDFMIVLFFALHFLKSIKGAQRKAYPSPINKVFKLLFFFMALSISMTELVHGIPIIMRDWFILPQLIKYWLIFLLVKSIDIDEKKSKNFAYGILLVGAVMAFISFCQYFNLLGVNTWLTPIYQESEDAINSLIHRYGGSRVSGTSGNPNIFGYFIVCTTACIAGFLLHCPNRTSNTLYWLILCFISIASLFTLSRTVIATMFLVNGTLIYFTIKYHKGGRAKVFNFFLAAGLAAFLFFNFFRTEGFIYRVSIENLQTRGSYHARKRDFVQPFKKSLDSVALTILGQGPSKATLRTDSHNDYGWFFQRFGIVGLLLYVSLIVFPLKRAIRLYRFSTLWWQKFLSIASILVICNWALNGMALSFFKMPQMMSCSTFFIAIPYARWSYQTIANYNSKIRKKGFANYARVGHYPGL
ncbi:hypothetical protein QUF75_01070 [Desulfococcaceae bacterium HSG7]|nr:hypothetical protein [Desulfococcaceae bacterium HSG7]